MTTDTACPSCGRENLPGLACPCLNNAVMPQDIDVKTALRLLGANPNCRCCWGDCDCGCIDACSVHRA